MPYNLSEVDGQGLYQYSECISDLLAQEIPDLQRLSIILNDAIDGEVGIYCTHFIGETLVQMRTLLIKPNSLVTFVTPVIMF